MKLPEGCLALRLVFFSTVASDDDYLRKLAALERVAAEHFAGGGQGDGAHGSGIYSCGGQDFAPVVTLVAQPPLEGPLAVEVHAVGAENGTVSITAHDHHGHSYLFIDGEDCKQIISGGIFGRSKAALDVVRGILTEHRFDTHDIVRQWNYIENITAVKDGLQNYQQFNDARAMLYDGSVWPAGYPAATGIGSSGGGVVVEFDAARCGEDIRIVPVNNRLQVAAYSYSQDVLAGGGSRTFPAACGGNTPKFERAKMITSPGGYRLYISGTAAIRGQESLATDDVVAQTAATMENIEELLSAAQAHYERLYGGGMDVRRGEQDDERLRSTGRRPGRGARSPQPAEAVTTISPPRAKLLNLRVYIKRPEDFAAARNYLFASYPGVPAIYLQADICREELLVEIEALAAT